MRDTIITGLTSGIFGVTIALIIIRNDNKINEWFEYDIIKNNS